MLNLKNFTQKLEHAQNIVITTHIYPDADGLGSQIALFEALKSLGKNCYAVNEEGLPSRFTYLDPDQSVEHYSHFKKNRPTQIDLLIVVDTHELSMTGLVKEVASQANEILFIDHHPDGKYLSKDHCMDSSYSATGEIIAEIIESLTIPFTRSMGFALYTAILIDTSSFRYPNVTSRTHYYLAKFLETGFKPYEAYALAYGTKKISYLHLLGSILSSAQISENGKIAWLVIDSKNLQSYDSKLEDTYSIINHLLILEEIQIGCMFRIDEGNIKMSLRSKGTLDVGIIAQKFGGGGHLHSAAARIPSNQVDPHKQITEIVKNIQNLLID